MYTVLRDDLQALETTVRMKLRDQLLIEYQGDPEWEKVRAAEKVARATVTQRSAPQPGQGAQSLTVTTSTKQSMPKAMSGSVSIPDIAIGFEEIYLRFLNGKLIYKPNRDNDLWRKEFPIASLANPLEGTFDISRCGYSGNYLQISTGFRKSVNPANRDKVEVWIVPQFVLQRDPRAKAFNDCLRTPDNTRNKTFAILFTWGGWTNLSWYEAAGHTGYVIEGLEELRSSARHAYLPHLSCIPGDRKDFLDFIAHLRQYQCIISSDDV
jgi:hypothetical protein